MLGFDGNYPVGHSKAQILVFFMVKDCKKSAVKH